MFIGRMRPLRTTRSPPFGRRLLLQRWSGATPRSGPTHPDVGIPRPMPGRIGCGGDPDVRKRDRRQSRHSGIVDTAWSGVPLAPERCAHSTLPLRGTRIESRSSRSRAAWSSRDDAIAFLPTIHGATRSRQPSMGECLRRLHHSGCHGHVPVVYTQAVMNPHDDGLGVHVPPRRWSCTVLADPCPGARVRTLRPADSPLLRPFARGGRQWIESSSVFAARPEAQTPLYEHAIFRRTPS